MNVAILLLIVISSHPSIAQMPLSCSGAYGRLPYDSDISVVCGLNDIQLSIKLCPVYYAGFLPTDLALNGKHNGTACLATVDNSTETLEAKFTLLLDSSESNQCGNIIEIQTESLGSGSFGSYSNIQTVVFSGFVDTAPISESGLVSYSTNLYYNFSCRYPLQYILNNTEILTSFGAVAVNSNNGSFISTLKMGIFTDNSFSTATPSNGTVHGLKETIYVQISSNNSATSYNVYLDQCFATPSPFLTSAPADRYNLFIGCNVSSNVSVISRGIDKFARFSFKSFRFVQHNGQATSSIYLHCFTRLCQPEACPAACQSSRRKRDAAAESTTDPAVISYGPIRIAAEADESQVPSVSSGKTSLWAEFHTGLLIGLILAMTT